MTAFRHYLFAVTWMVLSTQALVIALRTADTCHEREHTHGGVTAPDCPMHHATPTQPATGHHPHHGDASPAPGEGADTAQLSCRCSTDSSTLLIGQAAVLQLPFSQAPLEQIAVSNVFSDSPATDVWSSPPSPPPR